MSRRDEWHRRRLERWRGLNAGTVVAHYVKASLHRRIFFLIGGAILVNAFIVGAVGRSIGHDAHQSPRGWVLVTLFALMLWAVSGKLARRLTRPFVELARVAQEIGQGNLAARYTFGRHGRSGEAFLIGASINRMAERIERQLRDQRELLAAVSHEVRTPLARIRMLVELGRGHGDAGEDGRERFLVDAKTFDDLDREVMEIDALVGELLASSRLDFAALSVTELDALDVATRAIERQSLDAATTLRASSSPLPFRADPTLLQRALANLLRNAAVHGGGVDALIVTATAATVRFEVTDRGPGLPKGAEQRIFESFYRGGGDAPDADTHGAEDTHGALGLGLALVQRIASAHGGRAFAENRTDGPGARVGVELPRAPGVTGG